MPGQMFPSQVILISAFLKAYRTARQLWKSTLLGKILGHSVH